MDEIQIVSNFENFIDLCLLTEQLGSFHSPRFVSDEFLRVGFTHHSEILAKEKSIDGRLFYLTQCAAVFWTVEALKSNLRGDLYSRTGAMPSNFLRTLPEPEQARRAIRSFKDEYLLDFINIEDENDPDERLIKHGIIANIKQFILSFGGSKFCFMGHEFRVVVESKEIFIDLLFFNRALRCLVAIELKRGEFKAAHLGQLNLYLSALDEYVKQDDEAPSIGILLCKEADRSFVEFAVRDYTKPMGVATYRTRNEMPEPLQKALPDFDDIKQLLDNSDEEGETE
jgi:predicted nuclease of restriction endonuclease-like (RecB) superfamily